MVTSIVINSIEEARKKDGGAYWKADTSEGQMSIWDSELVKKFTNLPNNFNVEIKINGQYKNIQSVHDVTDEQVQAVIASTPRPAAEKPVQSEIKPYIDADEKKFASMAISYAKDLVVAGKIEHNKFRSESIAILDLYKEMTGRVESVKTT